MMTIGMQGLFSANQIDTQQATAEEIYVEAYQFGYDFYRENGAMTTDSLQVVVNQVYTFIVTSLDVNHGFRITSGGVNINMPASPGVNFTAEAIFTQVGVFQAVCSVECNNPPKLIGHNNMDVNVDSIAPVSNDVSFVTITVTSTIDIVTATETSTVNQTQIVETTKVETVPITQISNLTIERIVVITEEASSIIFINIISSFILLVTLRVLFKKFKLLGSNGLIDRSNQDI